MRGFKEKVFCSNKKYSLARNISQRLLLLEVSCSFLQTVLVKEYELRVSKKFFAYKHI